jgi:hypothetical protein
MNTDTNWTKEAGDYHLKNVLKYYGNSLSSVARETVHYASKIELHQIIELERNPSVTSWYVPPHVNGIAWVSSVDQTKHIHFPDFICTYKGRIHVIENKADSLIEASYNVEPMISKLAAGTIAPQSLTDAQLNAIAIRDKRIAAEQLANVNNFYYHLTFHFPPRSSVPSTFHELYIVIKEHLAAYSFASQKDILTYVNSRPEFRDMSRHSLIHHLKQMIAKRYFTKEHYDFCLAQGKVRAAADVKAAEQAHLDAKAKLAANAERHAEWLADAVQRKAKRERLAAEQAEQERLAFERYTIRQAQWKLDHPEEAAKEAALIKHQVDQLYANARK